MNNVILITPDDRIELKEYRDYKTYNELVDGWFELCDHLDIGGVQCDLICNEEFLFLDKCEFNSIATLLCKRRIYGNLVIAAVGYTMVDGIQERDSVPFSESECNKVYTSLQNYKVLHAAEMIDARIKYSAYKPKPSATIISMTADEFAKMFGLDEEDEK